VLAASIAAAWLASSPQPVGRLAIDLRSACDHPPGYQAVPAAVVESAVAAARVSANDEVYDVGVGSGAFLLHAARIRKASGIANPTCAAGRKAGVGAAAEAGLTERAVFRAAPIAAADFAAKSVVSVMLSPADAAALAPTLLGNLPPGARIVSFVSTLGDWKPDRTVDVDGWTFHLYTVSESTEARNAAASRAAAGSALVQACRSQLPEIVPRTRPDSCECLELLFAQRLTAPEIGRLASGFSRERFLLASVARVGLHQEVAACLR
jgi:hypothetical protein